MTSVLVETSVWRRYFSGGAGVRQLGELLDEDGAVVIHPWVVGELVLGGLSKREELLMRRLPGAPLVTDAEVLEMVRHHRLERRAVGWVDVQLLASAMIGGLNLWSLDRDLAAGADRLGIQHLTR
jgi:predicted nucleic acid-binding protein